MSNNINKSLPIEQRLGQIGINNQGEKITIIAYRDSHDIDVQFEDGVIVINKGYSNFLRGKMKHPIRYEESFAYHIEVELGLDINKIWNFEKNIVNPYEIFKSCTKKVWLYCLEKGYHNDEGGYEVSCDSFYRGGRCSYCGTRKTHRLDSLAYLYPQIAEMIVADERNNVTMEDMYKISPRGHKKFYFKCKECGKSSNHKKELSNIIGYKFSCEYCSDGVSIPEKFMTNILKQLNIDFMLQFNEEWSDKYRYDFYIPLLNMIIETHGLQHYEDSFESCNGKTLKEEQENDRVKKELALNNNIEEYIIIDCRYSKFDWLKENIIKELSNYFDLLNINWNLAWEESQNSLCVKAWKLWNDKKNWSSTDIANELKLDISTIIKYLKNGARIGLCDYTKEESFKRGYKKYEGINQYYSTVFRVINSIGEEKLLCGNQIYNNNSSSCEKTLLNISRQSFNKYIRPYGNIDVLRIEEMGATKFFIEKVKEYNGWQFIEIKK